MKSFLIIQTAFTGDVILATPLVEKLHACFPDARIDILLRKGNEALFAQHPFLHNILIWDKKQNKLKNLFSLARIIRKNKYDTVINLQRFASSGLVTMLSGAKETIGFTKNPFALFFSVKVPHAIGNRQGHEITHETARNLSLIRHLTDETYYKPALYPSASDVALAASYKNNGNYVCIAPASVWFTKQFPVTRWAELIEKINSSYTVYLLGGSSDFNTCEQLRIAANDNRVNNLCGKLSLLESAALMKDAVVNYVNDSAPLHLASAVNAPVRAVFCSTIPAFGFGPLSDDSKVVETHQQLSCRPCGLHGKKACPEGHFKCATTIDLNDFFT